MKLLKDHDRFIVATTPLKYNYYWYKKESWTFLTFITPDYCVGTLGQVSWASGNPRYRVTSHWLACYCCGNSLLPGGTLDLPTDIPCFCLCSLISSCTTLSSCT